MYLATQRGCSQDAAYRSFHTFNFGGFAQPHRVPTGNLLVFNDDTLGGGHRLSYTTDDDCLVVLLPVAGAIVYRRGRSQGTVDVGQAYTFFARRNETFQVSNPYDSELVNYIQMHVRVPLAEGVVNETAFDLDHDRNQLQPFLITSYHTGPYGYIGKFEGRHYGHYIPKNPDKEIFACVIEGVFEIQDRLLENRDAVVLHNTDTVAFEALSADAIMLILEV